ncbi:MAG: alginate lyase family protein [Planctomycetota bacterium]
MNTTPAILLALFIVGSGLLSWPGPLHAAEASDPGEFDIPVVLPLNTEERAELQRLIEHDTDAARYAEKLRALAVPMLGTPATPLEVIHYEGLVNTDPRRIETVRSLKQMGDAAWLLRYWQATEDPAAEATLRDWIAAWTSTYRFTGNDVNENKLVPLLIGYIDLRDGFPADQRDTADALFRQLGEHHARRADEATHLNNRFAKHLRIAALAGLAFDESAWLDAARAGVQRFVRESLRADGTSFDLEERDTLTYHGSALKPMIELSILFDRNALPEAEPLYFWRAETGASVAKSVDFVVPYATGEKTREEWKNSKVALDRQRAEAGLAQYQPGLRYDPKQATDLLDLAAYYRPDLTALVAQLTEAADSQTRFPTWLTLNHAALRQAREIPSR